MKERLHFCQKSIKSVATLNGFLTINVLASMTTEYLLLIFIFITAHELQLKNSVIGLKENEIVQRV